VGRPIQATIPDAKRQLAVRQVLVDGKRIQDVAHRLHIGVESVEKWINDPRIRGDLQITEKSGYKPRHRFTLSFKQTIAERVKSKGESPAAIAREFLGLTPGMIRNWCEGFDMQPEPALEVVSALPPALVRSAPQVTPPEPEALQPPPPPAPEPSQPEPEEMPQMTGPQRHPRRDEAVAAYRSGMKPADIITALELEGVTIDAIHDWAQEDRPKSTPPAANANGSRSRYTDEQRAAAVQRWVEGESSATIARDLKCTSAAIDQWAKKAGAVRLRRPSGGIVTPEVRAEALRRVATGQESRKAIAASLRISEASISLWIAQEAEAAAEKLRVERIRQGVAEARAAEHRAVPEPTPAPAPAAAPSLIVAPPAKKIEMQVIYACPHCKGAISLPPAEPGVLRVTSGNCPHCSGPVIL